MKGGGGGEMVEGGGRVFVYIYISSAGVGGRERGRERKREEGGLHVRHLLRCFKFLTDACRY